MLKTYHGSCHCGAVQFEVELDSHAEYLPVQLFHLPKDMFLARRGEARRLSIAGRRVRSDAVPVQHQEESALLLQALRRARLRSWNRDAHRKMYGVNVGCLDNVSDEELSRLSITYVDGNNDRWQGAPEFFRHL